MPPSLCPLVWHGGRVEEGRKAPCMFRRPRLHFRSRVPTQTSRPTFEPYVLGPKMLLINSGNRLTKLIRLDKVESSLDFLSTFGAEVKWSI